MAFVQPVHTAVSGRARFRIEGLYRSESLKQYLESELLKRDGIRSISVSTLTGKILVYFSSGRPSTEIASFIGTVVSDYKEATAVEKKRRSQEGCHDIQLKRGGISKPRPPSWVRDDTADETCSHSGPPSSKRQEIRRLLLRAQDQESEAWHLMDAPSVLRNFGTDPRSGLCPATAQEILKRYGPNLLPESVPRSRWTLFFDQFKSLPVYMLSAAALLSIFTGGAVDAAVIMSVVLINSIIGYVTENNSEKIIFSLKRLVRPSALILRDGQICQVSAETVVPGDLLVLRPGSYVTADARLLEIQHLSIDESSLTGESMPVQKTTEPLTDGKVPLADRTNMVYMGTLVTGGQGIAVVVGTGRFTELGKIQMLIGEAKPPDTPMEKQLDRMGTQLVYLSSAVCGAVFLIGLLRGYGFLQMLKLSISLAVAAVPEGLPAVATTTLALGIRTMQKHHALIRHLEAVETLGSVQTICLDKTGTLTLNRMSVEMVYVGLREIDFSNQGFRAGEEEINPFICDELLRLLHTVVLCNESEIFRQNGEFVVNGSPTENALIQMALGSGVDVIGLRKRHPLHKIYHRSENRNFMITLHEPEDQQHRVLAVKGSPTEVLAVCEFYLLNGEKFSLTDEDRHRIEVENERMAAKALRVLGVAYAWDGLEVNNSEAAEEIPKGLIWLGLVGMGDPIRSGMQSLVRSFHTAGISTVMITGDQTPTAYAIGKELNLSQEGPLEIFDSTRIDDVDPEVLKSLCERVQVFSRVSPAHKLQIVYALQKAGRVVAMTGDGINDGPALKAADIGIAMGHTGTDVAREVSDVVLEDDNLQTMIVAISQGRTIYFNIRKTIHYLLSTNMSEIMVMFAATAAGLGQPLNAMQLLWINLVTDIFPGLGLALEPPEPDVLSRPPRDPGEPIIQTKDFKRIGFESAMLSSGALGAYGYGIARYGFGPQASTLAFMGLTYGQIIHALSCRSKERSLISQFRERGSSPPNRYFQVAIGGTLALQTLTLFIPGLKSLLQITPLGAMDYLVVGGSALWPLLVNEMTKSTFRVSPVQTQGLLTNHSEQPAHSSLSHQTGSDTGEGSNEEKG
ncbi:MAG TPA: HAD-IC family P-type ATPase [Thermodesulfobacteriota bacterium]|nr:HAD-IC family P-type ATPase [Thermodesulfobacteriota bacterium]